MVTTIFCGVSEPLDKKSSNLEECDFEPSCIEQNLRLTTEERAIQHQRALDIFLEIEKARKQLYEKSQQSSEDPSRK